jgi:very-short-patch-repair endonuclease
MPRDIDAPHRMRPQRRSRGVDAAVATLATRQEGVVSHAQLIEIGLTPRTIGRRLEAQRLHELHRGVYAVGHRHVSRHGRYLAAVLASGSGAVLSHRSAAALWELRAPKEGDIDVTVPCDRRGGGDIRIHRNAIESGDVTTRHGIPVTTPLRTLLDLAAVVGEHELERAIRQAEYAHLTTTALLAEAVTSRPGRRGCKSLRKVLAHLGEAPGLTRSELEQAFLRFLRRHRLPMPELNVRMRIGGRQIEADCIWRARRLIVELDGRAAHDSASAFESDRARDSALVAAHWRVVRITNARMRNDGPRVAAELRALLA